METRSTSTGAGSASTGSAGEGGGAGAEPPAPLIRAESLWVRFGAVVALRNVSVEAYPGESVAIMGANGSGKTTLMRVIAGMERPALGGAWLGGLDCWRERERVWREVDLLTPDERLPGAYDARDCMRLFSPDADEAELEARARRLFDASVLGLAEPHRRVRVEQLSVGMRQKVALATVGSKRALLLDEPTEGLDPVVCHRFRAEARRGGRTVVTVTHDVREAEAADRVIVIRDGVVRGSGSPALLCRWLGEPTLEACYARLTAGERSPLAVGLRRVRVSEAVAPGTCLASEPRGGRPGPEGEVLLGRVLLRCAGRAPEGGPPGLVIHPSDAGALALDGEAHPRRSACWPANGAGGTT